MAKRMNRRGFLQTCGLTLSALLLGRGQAQTPPSRPIWRGIHVIPADGSDIPEWPNGGVTEYEPGKCYGAWVSCDTIEQQWEYRALLWQQATLFLPLGVNMEWGWSYPLSFLPRTAPLLLASPNGKFTIGWKTWPK